MQETLPVGAAALRAMNHASWAVGCADDAPDRVGCARRHPACIRSTRCNFDPVRPPRGHSSDLFISTGWIVFGTPLPSRDRRRNGTLTPDHAPGTLLALRD